MSTVAEDIWEILRELAKSQQDTDRRFKETDKKMQETDRQLRETDRQLKETDKQVKETSLKVMEVSKKIGQLGNRLGEFIEDALRPSVVGLFQKRGIEVHEVHQNVSAKRGTEGLEIDLLVVNTVQCIAVECKSNLGVDDVNDHLERLAKLKRLLPAYADKQVLGAVSAMVINENVAEYAYRKGLFIIGQNGEHLEIRNSADFVARIW